MPWGVIEGRGGPDAAGAAAAAGEEGVRDRRDELLDLLAGCCAECCDVGPLVATLDAALADGLPAGADVAVPPDDGPGTR